MSIGRALPGRPPDTAARQGPGLLRAHDGHTYDSGVPACTR
ncbi:hypothetical protein [Saccharomonospora piscinae]|nr:hypothetical protein [Saccharomonospora piscinae]